MRESLRACMRLSEHTLSLTYDHDWQALGGSKPAAKPAAKPAVASKDAARARIAAKAANPKATKAK